MEVLLVSEDLPEARRNDRASYLAQRTQIGSGNTRTLATGSPEAHAAAAPQSLLGGLEQWAASTQVSGQERTLSTPSPQPAIVWFGQVGQRAAATALERRLDSGSAARHGRGDAPELVLRGDPKTGQWISPDTKASTSPRTWTPGAARWSGSARSISPPSRGEPDFSGSPVIEVALSADGRLLEATIQRPSAHPEIDQAALQILRLASPFEPSPRPWRAATASVRFAYQWEFFGGELGTGTVRAGAAQAP